MEKEYYRFYRSVGEKYPEEEIVYNTLRGYLRRKFVLRYISGWEGSLLDIGCNKGIYLAEYGGGFAVGIDVSHHVLNHARQRLNQKGSNYFVVADAEELFCIKECTFSHILCSELLEHVYYPEKVIKGIARILKQGGTVLITVPNYSGKKPTWTDIGIMKNYGIQGIRGNLYYHSAFKQDEIALMVQSTGLQVLEKGTFEKEVRYATKIPVLFYYLFETINNILIRSKRLSMWNSMFLDGFSHRMYSAARFLHLDQILQNFFVEGARTYVLAQKGHSGI